MALRSKLWIGIAVVATVAGMLVWWNQPRPLPPLLQKVTAGGGYWGACPPEAFEPLALSPELNQRLAVQFPPGTTEEDLTRDLAAQGFRRLENCKGDDSIRSMAFGTNAMRAAVFWKADEGRLVWTKGFVFYNSL